MPDFFSGLMDGVVVARSYLEGQRIAALITDLQVASMGVELGAIAAGAIPVVGMAGVFAALGSGYLEARNMVRKENVASGYSQGFVMGLLGWEWSHVVSRFGRHGVL